MSRRKRRILLAGLGGVAATGVDIAVLATLAERGWPVGLSAFLGAATGALVGFAMSKYLAFRDHRPLALRQLGTYAFVSGITAVSMAILMFLACDLGHVPYLPAKLVCAVLVFLLWSYPAQRRLVFAPAPLST